MSLKPGDRTEARCTRCNDITGHIIIAIVGGEIIKVQCCACNSEHKYHPATVKKTRSMESTVRRISAGSDRKAVMAAAPRPLRTADKPNTGSKPTAVTRKIAQSILENERRWHEALERPSAPEARPYAIDMILHVGDVINHALFGMGVVLSVTRPDKASILFQDATRNMRCRVE